ncbi:MULTISPECIES: hypothetical protein [unclassified Sphingobacterium]|uniref:hypothetical protein n=1 Tax=unclassified Sphingobacterium TaxID=2609468 RepID=UPI0025E802BA|nr:MULTISPECIES: hypothetical protein [unclassified Sphingobacterium]
MKQRFFLIISILFITTLSACKKINSPEEINKADEQQVTLRLLLPQESDKASTYAISEMDQNTINTLDILAFKVADDGKEYYAYRKKGVLLRPNPTASEVNFHVDLLKSDDKYRFVLIANATAQLQTIPEKATTNIEKESLLGGISYTITAGWNASSPTNFTPLPMWGESMVMNGIDNNTPGFNVSMLRSLAAIDIQLSAADFVMEQVYVYNTPNKGRVTPLSANYDAASRTVTSPSLVAGTAVLTPVQYTSGVTALSNSIFLFESAAAQNIGQSTAVGLVIAGKYGGSTTTTYYRIDLADEQDKPFPILRNHRYTINISKVHGDGFGAKETAWSSKPVNMSTTIIPWNESSLSETGTTINYLKVSTTKAELTGFSGELDFSIWTDAPAAITLELPAWVSKLDEIRQGDRIDYKLHFMQNPSPTAKRNAVINAKLGRLTREVNITQGIRPTDIGPEFDFYLFKKHNLNVENGIWYLSANVEKYNYSFEDASLTQKTGEPYKESCVAIYGKGARLPTIQELRQLVPENEQQRNAVNAKISSAGGDPLYSSGNSTLIFFSSSTVPYDNKYFRGIDKTGTEINIFLKFPQVGRVYMSPRCVLSK